MQFKKPVISGLLALSLLANLLMPAFAYNSTGSTTDRITGSDTAQNAVTEYEETTNTSSETQVYATRSSTFTVLVPKTIILNGSDGYGAYVVGAKGDVLAEDSITIEPDSYNLTLYRVDDHTKETPASVTQDNTSVTGAQIEAISPAYATMEGSIQANGLKAGSWSTTMTFNIALNEETTKPFTVTADNKTELGVTDTTTNLDIPSNFVDSNGDNREVVGIDDNAFYDNNNLENVTIPGSVESIGDNAFADCDNLGRVEVADEVKEIGNNAFGGVDEVIYGGNATGSPWGANNVYASIDAIPSHTHTLEHVARVEATEEAAGNIEYWHCTDCDKYYRDAGCTDEITLADTIIPKIVHVHNFIHVPASEATADHPAIKEHWKCEGCGKYYSDANGNSEINEFDIYDGLSDFRVTSSNRAKVGYTSTATNLTIPTMFKDTNGSWYKVTEIDKEAFKNCTKLTTVSIPDTVTDVYNGAFSGCTNLKSIKLSDNLEYLATMLFEGCTSLNDIQLPENLKTIGKYDNGSGVPEFIMGEIKGPFSNCLSLTSFEIPSTVTSIDEGAFGYCTELKSITIPDSVTVIGKNAFKGCTGLTSITIPNSVTTIGEHAFDGCTGFTGFTIPNSVTTIKSGAFWKCSGLTSIEIPNSVTNFEGSDFFGWCTSLKSLKLPDGITFIPAGLFSNCTSLTSFEIPSTVTEIQNSAFSSTGLTEIIIPDGVTTIGNNAFSSCNGLTSIVIPEKVTAIGSHTFYGCQKLASVIIPNSVTSIGDKAFAYCWGLKSVAVPNSVTTIGTDAFLNVTKVIYNGTATGSPWGAKSRGTA